jgi:hypothetical protein
MCCLLKSPVADFIWSPKEPEAGMPITFDAIGNPESPLSYDPDGYITKYQWEFKNSNDKLLARRKGSKVNFVFPTEGYYKVTLKVIDNTNRLSRKSKKLYVRNPVPRIREVEIRRYRSCWGTYAGGRRHFEICDQLLFVVQAIDPAELNPKKIVNYHWDFGDGTTLTTTRNTVTHQYHKCGSYQITLRVTDDAGATKTWQDTVEIWYKDLPPIASFTCTISQRTVKLDASESRDQDFCCSTTCCDYHRDCSTKNIITHCNSHSLYCDPRNAIDEVEWTIDDRKYYALDLFYNYSFVQTGSHTIILRVKDDEGNWSEPVRKTVIVP